MKISRTQKKPRPKFTPRIVTISLQFDFIEPRFFHADFLLMGERPSFAVGIGDLSSQSKCTRRFVLPRSHCKQQLRLLNSVLEAIEALST